ncbi:uncharacterized protein [Onthophagus taurus]|uniref:uncharacterized protein n=1 Tax=Onthophagus taurus TaxID=166361 RepID=UPI0039BDB2AE
MKLIIFAISLIVACEAFSATNSHTKNRHQLNHGETPHVASSKRTEPICDKICLLCQKIETPNAKRHNSHKKSHNKKHRSVRDGEDINVNENTPDITTLCNDCKCNAITESTENPDVSTIPGSIENQGEQQNTQGQQARHADAKIHHNAKAHHGKHHVNKKNHH